MRLKQLHVDHKLVVKPYVVLNGKTLSEITASYVVVHNFMYQVASPVLAFDICLKVVKVLYTEFSHICKHIWHFSVKSVLSIDVPDMNKGVVELIENMRKLD